MFDFPRHAHIALAFGTVCGEIQNPFFDAVQIGITAAGETAQQVQCCRCLIIGLQNTVGVGAAPVCGKFQRIDDIAAIGGKVSRIFCGWNSAKLSAQSPPCSRKAFPSATLASLSFKSRLSPAKTSGGIFFRKRRVSSNWLLSGYSGSCCAGCFFQLVGVHFFALT